MADVSGNREMRNRLQCLFWPRHIAVIGASQNATSISGRPLDLLQQRSFPGTIYPVNPRHEQLRGLRAYSSIVDVPEAVDLAVIAVKAELVSDILLQCGAAGVRTAAVLSSGFSELGAAGVALQDELLRIADSTGMCLLGPNSEGFVNVRGNIPITFSPTFNLELSSERTMPGNVAIISQSGSLAFAVCSEGSAAGVGFSYVVSTGNEVAIDSLDIADYLLEDEGTSVVAMIVEGFTKAHRLRAIAARAHELGKHLVVAKLGRSSAGQRAAESHTAHLTGTDRAYLAAFEAYGIHHAVDQEDLVDLCMALSRPKVMSGSRVGIITPAGGAAIWVADALEAAGFVVPELSESLQVALQPHLPAFGSARNPVDRTSQSAAIGGAGALHALLDSEEVDGVVYVTSLRSDGFLKPESGQLNALIGGTAKPVLLYTYSPAGPSGVDAATALGAPWYLSPRRTARALAALSRLGEPAPPTPIHVARSALPPLPPRSVHGWCEDEVKASLGRVGIPIPPGEIVRSARQAGEVADRLGYPVVLKIQSPEVVHKTEVGGVVLGLKDRFDAEQAYDELMTRVGRQLPTVVFDGVLVEAQQAPGFELIVGVAADPDFGPQLLVGTGGIHTEVMDDTTLMPAPISSATADGMLRRLRSASIFEGSRQQAPWIATP